jgi:hypothetical protein
MLAHLFLVFIFAIPLAVYITLLRIDAKIGRIGFMCGLIAISLFQFFTSTEIFATATLFGAIALALDFIFAGRESRLNLISVTKEIICVYLVVTLLLTPFLYYVFATALPIPPNPPTNFSNDLLTFVLPPPVVLIGPHLATSKLGHFFATKPWWEQTAYLGPGLWILMWLFTRAYWRTQVGKFMVLNFALIAIMSLGPVLHVAGVPLVALPWRLLTALPLMDDALPGRFGMYLFLVVAVAAAICMTRRSRSIWSNSALAGLSLLFIVPDLTIWHQLGWVPEFGTPGQTRISVPRFFSSGQYRTYLAHGDNVLILPLGSGYNDGLLWQVQSDFYFNTIEWFGAIPPPDADRWRIMAAFRRGTKIPDFSEQLDAFLGAHQVRAIIVDPRQPGSWPRMLSEAGMNGVAVGGVLFYEVPAHRLVALRVAQQHAR